MVDVRRAADSAPDARRDFGAEINALLARADEARAQAADIDLEAIADATLRRAAAAADDALQRGSYAADGARAKIQEQQDRFKAGVAASGLSLDDEFDGVSYSGGGASLGATNKYAHMMDRRELVQDQKRL